MSTNVFKNANAATISNNAMFTTIYTAPVSKTSMVIQLDVCNLADVGITVDIQVTDSSASTTATLAKNVPVPVGSTFGAVGDSRKLVLESGDIVAVRPNTGSCSVVCSLVEDI